MRGQDCAGPAGQAAPSTTLRTGGGRDGYVARISSFVSRQLSPTKPGVILIKSEPQAVLGTPYGGQASSWIVARDPGEFNVQSAVVKTMARQECKV